MVFKEAIEGVAEATEDIVAIATEWGTCLLLSPNDGRFVPLFRFLKTINILPNESVVIWRKVFLTFSRNVYSDIFRTEPPSLRNFSKIKPQIVQLWPYCTDSKFLQFSPSQCLKIKIKISKKINILISKFFKKNQKIVGF